MIRGDFSSGIYMYMEYMYVAVLVFSKSVFGLIRTCLNPFTTGNPFLGTKLLGFSVGRGSGALKGLSCLQPPEVRGSIGGKKCCTTVVVASKKKKVHLPSIIAAFVSNRV